MPRSPRPLPVVLALALLAAGVVVAIGTGAATASTGNGQDSGGPAESSSNEHHDVSGRLRDTPSKPWTNRRHIREHAAIPPAGTTAPRRDGALQSTPSSTSATPTAGIGFQGVGDGLPGFAVNAAPPDTTGAAGPTQYVQWVNESFAVFDKSTGKPLPGFPKAGNTLWSGFGGGCEINNDGDPIVQYDKAADRWLLTQFSVTNPSVYGYLQCVAVSQTSDATGAYNRYSFSFGKTAFNDYPKVGIWPDAYYVTYNMFTNGTAFAGAKVCAMDRAKMLVNAAATQECFQTSTTYGGLLPSDADGQKSPPATTPNMVVAFDANRLALWKFRPSFSVPSASDFAGPTFLAVDPFAAACSGGGTCIPQPGTTQQLDSLADRLMYRLVYRDTPAGPRWLVTHSVTAGASVGVRWYELTDLDQPVPKVVQSGTYAPDGNFRWMSSAAMDKNGDIAVGYSLSGPTRTPTIAYSSRVPSDAAGVLSNETVVLDRTGSQTAGLSRWGDYSSMTVDPNDDCTFWYSTEYLATSGTFNWSTWVTSFKLPSCVPTPRPPSPPTGLTASASDTTISLRWTAPPPGSSAITSYDVYRDTARIGSSPTTDFTDRGLGLGETHTYTVTATSPDGTSQPSAGVTATTGTPRAATAPTGLTATGAAGSVVLSWTRPTDLGQPPASTYTIWRRTGTGAPIAVASTPDLSTTLTDSGLSNGTTYVYSVAAHSSSGDGARSAEVSATTANVPGAPSLTAATAVSPARGVALSWTVPATNGSGILEPGYQVYRSTTSGREVPLGTLVGCGGSPRCTYNDANAVAGQRYFYQVSARNAVGTGARSSEQRARAR